MVTSEPSRRMAARPNGTRSSGPPTSPRTLPRRLCIRKMTGSSPRSADLSRPFVSAGVDGIATSRPGKEANNASRLLLCCAAYSATPDEARITSGIGVPNM